MENKTLYAKVILPIRIGIEVSYLVPGELMEDISIGTPVRVLFANKEYIAIVEELSETKPNYKGEIREILHIEDLPRVSSHTIQFWQWISEYYMCSIGEVYRNAYQVKLNKTIPERSRATAKIASSPELSEAQNKALNEIIESHRKKIPALLKGVTGSGKTEVYIHLALNELQAGNNVLFMVPEIALSRQLSQRLEKIFGDRLFVYHSKQKASEKILLHNRLRRNTEPTIILGLRSSLFLPFENLGLIIVDEEHDSSYKQNEPAPRYHGRDTALMLATIYSANVLLGSATPSLESIYNTSSGRYNLVELNERYYGAEDPEIVIVDTRREEKLGRMMWPVSVIVKNAIEETLSKKEQVLVFRNRRSYSPVLQCIYCGDIPSCEHCNVPLSYHKGRATQSCHYCGYIRKFSTICTSCGKPGLKERGCGTEMIEEWIKDKFPDARVARFDAETTSGKAEELRIIKEFARHEIDILVGTQMISKGFDFEKLSLVVLIQADSMLAMEDFRAGERAMQLMVQLAGRSGRKFGRGKIIIQTAQPENNIYRSFLKGGDFIMPELQERKEFLYPPYTRMVKIIIKNADEDKATGYAIDIAKKLSGLGITDFDGPTRPPVEKINGKHIVNIWIRLPRRAETRLLKQRIYTEITSIKSLHKAGGEIYFDVDP